MAKLKSDRERFFEKVVQSGPTQDPKVYGDIGPCWTWIGSHFRTGRGQFWLRNANWQAHRVMYLLTHGELPDGSVVRHRCDNGGCVRPDHLTTGSHAENARDAMERGRFGAPSSEPMVVDILRRLELGEPFRAIADAVGVKESFVRNVRRGRTWKTVTAGESATIGDRARLRIGAPGVADQLRELWARNAAIGDIARELGTSPSMVFQWATRLGLPKRNRAMVLRSSPKGPTRPGKKPEAIRLLSCGESPSAVAAALGLSELYVNRLQARRLGK